MSKTVDYPQEFRKITEEMCRLYAKKNHDYGNSFADTWGKLGPISGITRISDKFNRVCNLVRLRESEGTQSGQVADESIEDTLIDLACYSIMAIIEERKQTIEKKQS